MFLVDILENLIILLLSVVWKVGLPEITILLFLTNFLKSNFIVVVILAGIRKV